MSTTASKAALNGCAAAAALAMAATLLTGCREVHGEAAHGTPPRPVKVIEVRPAEAPSGIRYSVSIQPYEQIPLAFKSSGQDLANLKGWVADSGEGRWTVQEAIDRDVPAPIITLALQTRFRSRQDDSYGARVLAALRNEFGGHAVKSS